jgi:MraZ protein
MMFFGKCNLPVSDKNQFTLPSSYLDALGAIAFLTQGFDQNLLLMPKPAFEALYSKVRSTSISDPLARLLSRLFLGGASELTVEKTGSIELPGNLSKYAGISKEMIVVGQGEYLELWSPEHWQGQVNRLNDFTATTHQFEKFDISLK